MENIFGKTLNECKKLMEEAGEPSFRGKQLYQWLYEKKAAHFDDCTNLSKGLREKLKSGEFVDVADLMSAGRDEVQKVCAHKIQVLTRYKD